MGKRLMMFLACLFLSLGMAMAQTKITGTVISSEDGQPVIGASVKVIGTKMGTVTNVDGNFSLTVPDLTTKLEISYIGMLPKTVKVSHNMRIALDQDNKNLDEVIVVAYGTAKKSSFTGSAAVLNAGDISKVEVSNPIDALSGKVSGVQINTTSGQPGVYTPDVRIRGISSINAGKEPLIIVDGAPFDGDMNTINSQDIASMTILKDAASAALYGARGANGVIIITTKSGHNKQSTVTVDAKWGSNSRAIPDYKYIDSPAKHYELWYSALDRYAKDKWKYSDDKAASFANDNLTASNDYGLGYNVYTVPNGESLIGSNGKLNPNATLGRVYTYNGQQYTLMPDNWTNATFQNSLRQEYTLSASGSTDKSSFYGSTNYLSNKGITKASGFERFTGRLKADYQLKPWLKMAGNFSYAHSNTDYLETTDDGDETSSGNVFALTTVAPIYPLYIRDGKGNIMYDNNSHLQSYDYGDGSINGMKRPYISLANPLSSNQLETHNAEGNSFNATGSAEIRFLKDFKFTSNNTVMVNEQRYTFTTNPFFGQYASSNGIVTKEHTRDWAYNYQQLLTWVRSFGDHDVDVMLGHEYYRKRYYDLEGYKTNQLSVYNKELSGAVVVGSVNSYTSDYNTEGYFGRIQYDYAKKYFGSLSYRRDASSHFDPDHRWGGFWSFGAAWLLNKEKWFNVSWIDELKYKFSYGEQGNDNITGFLYDKYKLNDDYLYTTYYSIKNSNGSVSLVPVSLGNKKISWEKQGNFNTGFEFSLFHYYLTGSLEYFYRKTSNMLFAFSLPASYGYTSRYDNVGDMVNKGVEIDLNATLIKTRDFEWDAKLNFTTYKNKVTYIPDELKSMDIDGVKGFSTTTGLKYIGKNRPMYTWYLRKYAGVSKETGEALYYKDVTDKDGKVTGQTTTNNPNEATYHLCGTALPDAYGGFGTNLTWKGFDFSVDFSYQLGGKVFDTSYQEGMGNTPGEKLHADILKAWTETNTNTNVPRLEFNDRYSNATSDRWLTSASYLTFQNFTVGYTLPKRLLSTMSLQKVRFYVVGDNIWTWSKRRGLDPRQSLSGVNNGSYYSPIRTISGGITVTF